MSEDFNFVDVKVTSRELGVILKACKGILGGCYIDASVSFAANSRALSRSHQPSTSSSSSLSLSSNHASFQSPHQPSFPLTAHIGAVVHSINDEVVFDYSLDAINKKLSMLERPITVKLIRDQKVKIGIVDIVKDPRKVKYLFEYLMTTNQNNEELLSNTIVASVSILVNHHKELEAIDLNSSLTFTEPLSPLEEADSNRAQHHERIIQPREDPRSLAASPDINSIHSYRIEGMCDKIARDLDNNFLSNFLSSNIALRMFGYLFKCPEFSQIPPMEFISNPIYMIIYYFFLATMKQEHTMHAIWKSLYSNTLSDIEVEALNDLSGISQDNCPVLSRTNPKSIFANSYVLSNLYTKFKASDFYELVVLYRKSDCNSRCSFQNKCCEDFAKSTTSVSTMISIDQDERGSLTSDKASNSFSLLSIFNSLRQQSKVIGHISFHKSSYIPSQRGNTENIDRKTESATDIWIASIEESVKIIDYFRVPCKTSPLDGELTTKANVDVDTEIHPEHENNEMHQFQMKNLMERNVPFITPNTLTQAYRSQFSKPKLISGSFTSSEGKKYYSLSLLCYETATETTVSSFTSIQSQDCENNTNQSSTFSSEDSAFSSNDSHDDIACYGKSSSNNYSENSRLKSKIRVGGIEQARNSQSPSKLLQTASTEIFIPRSDANPTVLAHIEATPTVEEYHKQGNIESTRANNASINSKIESTIKMTSSIFSNMFTNSSSFFDMSSLSSTSKSNLTAYSSSSSSSSYDHPPTSASTATYTVQTTSVSSSTSLPAQLELKSKTDLKPKTTSSEISSTRGNYTNNNKDNSRFKQPASSGSRFRAGAIPAIPKGLAIISDKDITYLRRYIADKYTSDNSITINPNDLKFEVKSHIQFINKEQESRSKEIDTNITRISDSSSLQSSHINVIDQKSFVVSSTLKWTTIIELISAAILECKIVLWSRQSGSVIQIIIEWLRETIKPFEWCMSCSTSIYAQALKSFQGCPTPFIFGLYSDFIDFSDEDALLIDVDSGVSLQAPLMFKKFRSVIERFGDSTSLLIGNSIYNYDNPHIDSPWNACVYGNKMGRDNIVNGSNGYNQHLHQKIEIVCKSFISKLVQHVKICCLTPVKFSNNKYLEVIFNESIFYHLLHRDNIKNEKSGQDKYFFDLLIRTQMFSNLICSYFDDAMIPVEIPIGNATIASNISTPNSADESISCVETETLAV